MISIEAWDRKCQDLNAALSKISKLKKRIEKLENANKRKRQERNVDFFEEFIQEAGGRNFPFYS